MNKMTTVLATTAILLLVGAPASAQVDIDNARVEIYAGGSFMNAENLFNADDPFRSEFDNGGKFGFRVATELTEAWGAEASYGFATNDLAITPLEEPTAQDRNFDMTVHQLVGNVTYSFGDIEGLRPFVTAGLGFSRFSPSDEAERLALAEKFLEGPAVLEPDNQFNFNFGGGVEGVLSERFGYRIGLRDHITGTPRFGLPKEPGEEGPFFPVEGAMHNVELTAGLVIHIFRR